MNRSAVWLLTVVAGCSSAKYTPTGTVPPRAPREPERLVVTMAGETPPRDAVVAGRLHASGGDAATSVEMLRKEAARNGLDGVMEVQCAPAGSADEGSCDGKGFVYR